MTRRRRHVLALVLIGAIIPALAGCIIDEGKPPGFNSAAGAEINDDGVITGWGPTDYGIRGFIKLPDQPYQIMPTIGDASVLPEAINDDEVVVGALWISYLGTTIKHPFRWKSGEGMTDLGNFGGTNGESTDVNDAGTIVGWSDTAGTNGQNGKMQAWVWEPTTKVKTPLPTLDGLPSFAAGINNHGDIVGWVYTAPNRPHAVLWKRVTRELVDIGPPGVDSEAHDINIHGVSAGLVRPNSYVSQPVRWPATTPVVESLGTLGTPFGCGNVINDAGVIIGSDYTAGADSKQHAFRWDPTTKKMSDLGVIDGDIASHAAGLNQHGVAVGWSAAANGTHRVVRYTPDPPPT